MNDKPKRKYTSTPEGREAKRRSLEKVRTSVPREVLYRSTDRRKESCRSNFGLAREAKRRKHEQGRSTAIRHGLTCADLRGSLAMAGATPEELEARRQQFLAAFAPRSDQETRLLLGMADCLWRREQAVHVHAVELTIGLKARLIVAAEPGQAKLGEVVVARLALDIFSRTPDLNERLGKLNGRLEHLAWLFLAGRDEEAGFSGKPRWNRHNHDMIDWSAAAMGNPLLTRSQVAQALAPKTGEMKPASEFEWKGAAARQAERRERIKQQALDTSPHLWDYREHEAVPLADLLKPGESAVLLVDGGRTEVRIGEGESPRTFFLMGGTAQVAAGIEALAWPEWREKEVGAALRQEYLRTSLALRGKGSIGGVSRADLVQVFMDAFGRDGSRASGIGSREDEACQPETAGGEASSASPGSRVVSPGSSANPETQIPNPGSGATPDTPVPSPAPNASDQGRIRAAAHAAWDLVKVFEDRARQEKEHLAAILAQAGQSARQRIDQIMAVFTPVTEIFLAVGEKLAKLQQKLCDLLKGRGWGRIGPGDAKAAPPRQEQGLGIGGRSLGLVDLGASAVWINPRLREQFLNDIRSLADPPSEATEPEGPEGSEGPKRRRLRWRGGAFGGVVLEGGKVRKGEG